MTPAMTVAALIVGLVLMFAAWGTWRADRQLAMSAFLAGIGTPIFGAAAFDLIVRIA